AFAHQYAEPGEYEVFAYWFDLSGHGNFAVLKLTVLPAGAPGGDGGAAAALPAAAGAGGRAAATGATGAARAEAAEAGHSEQALPAGVGLSQPEVAAVVRALARGRDARSDGVDAVFAADLLFQV